MLFIWPLLFCLLVLFTSMYILILVNTRILARVVGNTVLGLILIVLWLKFVDLKLISAALRQVPINSASSNKFICTYQYI